MIAVTEQWGPAGFEEHCRHMQQFYQKRAATMHLAAVKVTCSFWQPFCLCNLLPVYVPLLRAALLQLVLLAVMVQFTYCNM